MEYIYLGSLFFVLILILTIYLYNKNKIIEGMIPESKNMEENIYKPYGITIDRANENLIQNGKVINYSTNFNKEEGINLSNNKIETSKVLRRNGFPVCNFYEWDNQLNNESNLIKVQENLKFPIVLKYNYGDKGTDVYTDIINNEQLIEKINYLKNQNKNSLLIEEQTDGDKYRIMILNGKFIYANKQIKPKIKGDGKSTIKDLINNYPKKIKLVNEDLIKQQGYNINDKLEYNKEILVTNVLSGMNGVGEIEATEKDVHPTNLDMFIKLNNLLGLNLSGIDYIGPDLSIPYFQGGKIIEVNPYPTFNIREQKKPYIAQNWVNALFN